MIKQTIIVFGLLFGLSSCTILPDAGPSTDNIYGMGKRGAANHHIIPVTEQNIMAARAPSKFGFPSSFYTAGKPRYETIRPGDVLQITVWENVDDGLFASLGQRVTPLSEMTVSESGKIFMPYVGQIAASGRSPEDLRGEISQKLEAQTPDPQVEVHRKAGEGGGALVFSEGGGGLIPFNAGNGNLASMIASAGGVSGDPKNTQITLARGNQSGTILLQELYDNEKNNVVLKDKDRIMIEKDRRYFRMMGSGGTQSLVPFSRGDVSVLDGIAETGGLNAATADPSGIFIFRTINADRASRMFGKNFTSPQNIVFTVNLREAEALFTASKFMLESGDTVFITEAPFVSWTEVINAFAVTIDALDTIDTIADGTTALLN